MPPTLLFSASSPEAQAIAEAAEKAWRGLAAALSPIIGERGFAALHRRCLYLLRNHYPWLLAAHGSAGDTDAFAALRAALAQQPQADAAAASLALLHTLDDVLTNLIGESLTEQILGPLLDHPLRGDAAQESPP